MFSLFNIRLFRTVQLDNNDGESNNNNNNNKNDSTSNSEVGPMFQRIIELKEGISTLGRGEWLGILDKKCSRTQAAIGVNTHDGEATLTWIGANQMYLLPKSSTATDNDNSNSKNNNNNNNNNNTNNNNSNENEIYPSKMDKGRTYKLSNGDQFWLIPNQYWFEVDIQQPKETTASTKEVKSNSDTQTTKASDNSESKNDEKPTTKRKISFIDEKDNNNNTTKNPNDSNSNRFPLKRNMSTPLVKSTSNTSNNNNINSNNNNNNNSNNNSNTPAEQNKKMKRSNSTSLLDGPKDKRESLLTEPTQQMEDDSWQNRAANDNNNNNDNNNSSKYQERYIACMVLGGVGNYHIYQLKFLHIYHLFISSLLYTNNISNHNLIFFLELSGDAIGYNNGDWEFEYDGECIHQQLEKLGGLPRIDISRMIVSDDTVILLPESFLSLFLFVMFLFPISTLYLLP